MGEQARILSEVSAALRVALESPSLARFEGLGRLFVQSVGMISEGDRSPRLPAGETDQILARWEEGAPRTTLARVYELLFRCARTRYRALEIHRRPLLLLSPREGVRRRAWYGRSTEASPSRTELDLAEALHARSGTRGGFDPGAPWSWVKTLSDHSEYARLAIPKGGGRWRQLEVPSAALKSVQGELASFLVKSLPVAAPACAFVPGRSVVLHASVHRRAVQALSVDVRDFFGSVRREQVGRALDPTWAESRGRAFDHPLAGWSPEFQAAVIQLAFGGRPIAAGLPQGAPTSPVLANLSAAPLDHLIRANGNLAFGNSAWVYTRYADDLVLSVSEHRESFHQDAMRTVRDAVRKMGWTLSKEKTKRWSAKGGKRLRICGMRLHNDGDDLQACSLSREGRRKARVAVRRLAHHAAERAAHPRPIRLRFDDEERAELSAQRKNLAEARGQLSWAFAVTADARLMGLGSRNAEALIDGIAAAAAAAERPDSSVGQEALRYAAVKGWSAGLPGWPKNIAARPRIEEPATSTIGERPNIFAETSSDWVLHELRSTMSISTDDNGVPIVRFSLSPGPQLRRRAALVPVVEFREFVGLLERFAIEWTALLLVGAPTAVQTGGGTEARRRFYPRASSHGPSAVETARATAQVDQYGRLVFLTRRGKGALPIILSGLELQKVAALLRTTIADVESAGRKLRGGPDELDSDRNGGATLRDGGHTQTSVEESAPDG